MLHILNKKLAKPLNMQQMLNNLPVLALAAVGKPRDAREAVGKRWREAVGKQWEAPGSGGEAVGSPG
jgi:hypothetical protein